MPKKIPHIRQSDPVLDRELREIINALNILVENLAAPSSSFPKENQFLQVVNVGNDLYSVAIQSKDGLLYSLPGLFQKTSATPKVGSADEVISSDARGKLSFNPVSTIGAVDSVTATAGTPIVISGTGADPTVGITKATASTDGYLSSADWSTFNNKQPAGSYLTTADIPQIRSKATALTADADTEITYDSAMPSGTVNVVSLSCKDSSGAEVEVTISGATNTHFHAVCPVNATLVWLAIKEL